MIFISSPASAASLQGGTETILVAEDDSSLQKLTAMVLSNYGYVVIEAVDGQSAVEKLVENSDRINLVILDAIMPKKNGREAYQEMRLVRPELKAVFLSGYSRDLCAVGNVLEENSIFIQKPFLPDELLVTVRKMLDK